MPSRNSSLVFAGIISCVAYCLIAAAATDTDKIAIAGKLELDYHAEFMVARDKDSRALNWNNCGLFMGCFGDFGFDGPKDIYPRYQADLQGSPAIIFDGGNRYRHFPDPTPESICDGSFSVEVWGMDLEPADGKIISWGGFELTAADFKIPKDGKWHHLAVIVDKNAAKYFCDGIRTGERTIGKVEPKQIVVGENLKGSIAAIRVHNEAITEEQLAHNIKGGVLLGTKLFVNIDPANPNDPFFGDPSLPQFKTVYSKHFRSTWEPAKDEKNVMAERLPKQLEEGEKYFTAFEQLGYHMPIVSANADLRGDGVKYIIPIGNDWNLAGGGGWMGWSSRGFGFNIQGPGWFSGHELGHGTQGHQLSPMSGGFWEVHTSWLDKAIKPGEPEPVGILSTAHLFPGNGRNYYHTWQIFDHLSDSPEYGPMFITKMWNARKNRDGSRKYPWATGEEIDPDPSTPFRDECVKMARRMITFDFSKHDAYVKGADKVDLKLCQTVLEPISYQPGWYRSPKALSPMQWGFNICPLEIRGEEVKADLQGYKNPDRGSHWSASFVAVQADGSPRYSDVWNEGEMKFKMKPDDKELYLVVAATPTKIATLETCGDYRSDDWCQFPYKVRLEGAIPREVLVREKPDVPGKPHPNGGGFVADTAHANAGAYVGPNAMVLENGQVLEKARIEDYAVVKGTVKDNAIISDFAVVEKDTTVRGNAKIRNRAIVSAGCDIAGEAKVLENATVISPSTKVSGYVTIKSSACVYGGNVRGTAIIDGHYAKGNDINKGCWFTWSWGSGKNAGETDEEYGGIYCQYKFDKVHPYLAWDTYGVTWGYLVNNPEFVNLKDKSEFKSSLLMPEAIIPSLDTRENIGDNYAQQLQGYLIPSETGDYTFWLSADDEGELWLGDAASDKPDKLICFTREWAGPKEFTKHASQKSQPVHLEKGKVYPLMVLHAEIAGGDHVQVAWTKPGSEKPEIIGKEILSVNADRKQPGVRQRIWGELTKIADLIKRPDYPEGKVLVENRALSLNGKDQFVEMTPDVADMRDITIDIDLLWEGNKNATILEFVGRDGGNAVLSAEDAEGKLSFSITNNGRTDAVRASAPLTSGRWIKLQLMLGEKMARLLVDGKELARNDNFTMNPDEIRSVTCYLGRGKDGNFFKGKIDSFTIYSLALQDKQPPTPNPSEWLFAPEMAGPDKAVMHAVEASDPRGIVEYKFTETSGNSGGRSSDWQKESYFVANGLRPGVEYEYEFTTRDINGNESKPSPRKKIRWQEQAAFCQDDSEQGLVVMEAEHFSRNIDSTAHKWELDRSVKNSGGDCAMVGLPKKEMTYTPFSGPRMDYYVDLKKTGQYWLWLRAYGPHWRNDSVNIAFDYQIDTKAAFIDLGTEKFRWRRYGQPITVNEPGVHVLSIWLREDATILDRMVLTCKEDYKPSEEIDSFKVPVGIGPAENKMEKK